MKFLIIGLFLFSSLEGTNVRHMLDSIPSKDQEKIEFVFSYLVQRESLGYVLFGQTKAVSCASIPISCTYALVPPSITTTPLRYQKSVKQCWEVWKKYEHRFKHPNFIICTEHDDFKVSAFISLFFIEKKKTAQLVENNYKAFEEVLGQNFSVKKFMDQLEHKKKLRPLIKHDEKLLGILLGFGEESAETFKKMQLGQEVSESFRMAGFKPKNCSITPVSFRGDPDSSEVKRLIETYTKELHEIDLIFNQDHFLSKVLGKLCEE